MTNPITFDSATPRFALPFLYAGQAQKEVFVNEALSLADAIMHCAVEGEADTPPASPVDGTAWLVGASPGGDWTGHAGMLACRQSGQWLFVQPREGLRVTDRSSGQDKRWLEGQWRAPASPAEPSGGVTVDVEARAAIVNLLQKLRDAGVFPAI